MKYQVILVLALVSISFAQIWHLQPQCDIGLPGLTDYLTEDFQNYLNANNYSSYGFVRTDLTGGSFGGRSTPNETLNNIPWIFFHGNSDIAIGNGTEEASWQTGFRDLIQYLISQGYSESELYITTWGPADPNLADQQTHSWDYVNYLRQFTEAVIGYTGATQFNVVAHSMGVTLARKVIKGGNMTDTGVEYYVGESLETSVNAFISLAGANWGLQVCEFEDEYPTCGQSNGFYPGTASGSPVPEGLSTYLADVNESDGIESNFIATLWNYPVDSVIGVQTFFGHNTSEISYQDATKVYDGYLWTHFDIRDGTCSTVLQAVNSKSLS